MSMMMILCDRNKSINSKIKDEFLIIIKIIILILKNEKFIQKISFPKIKTFKCYIF